MLLRSRLVTCRRARRPDAFGCRCARRPIQEEDVVIRRSALPAFIVVSVEDIARRAYEIYVQRGRLDGSDREDWRRAERELKAPVRDSDRGDGRFLPRQR
jgi:hypothetical protein